jgi:hypothetical protein
MEPHAEEAATAAVSKYEVAPAAEPAADALPSPESFEALAALFEARREAVLHTHLVRNVHLVRLEPGRLEFRPGEHAPRDSPGGSSSGPASTPRATSPTGSGRT